MQLYEKYKQHKVRFVSLTADPKDVVEEFVTTHQISWPVGFGASRETIRDFGALQPSPPNSEVVVMSTFYLIGREGRIAYSDHFARYDHAEPDEICQELDEAIEAELSKQRSSEDRVQKRPDGRTRDEDQDADRQ